MTSKGGELRVLSEQARDAEAAREAGDTEDFDAFWAEADREANRPRLNNVRGVNLVLPASVPLKFEMEATRLANSTGDADTRYIVGQLFGRDGHATDNETGQSLDVDQLIDTWVGRGMEADQFQVLLMWAAANLRGMGLSLADARDELRKMRAAKDGAGAGAGKAATRGGSSKSTGRGSKQTSSASTGSRRGTSRS